METIQLECGNCKQLMAIGVEHMGGQVQCPHCQAVVQTPVPTGMEPAPVQAPVPNMPLEHPESIFGKQDASDSVMGESTPKVEMPSDTAAAAAPEADFTQFKTRPVYTSSVISLIALIFLVPYAIVMTGFVIYLVFVQGGQRYDPLEILRDPVPDTKKGGAKSVFYRQPVPTHPLAAHLTTTLGKPIQIGDLVVTFQHVRLTEDGDLQLFFRAKNESTNSAFEPMNDVFVLAKKSSPDPYTFVETKSKKVEPIYGAYLYYHKSADGKDDPRSSAILGPREETYIALVTTPNYHKHVAAIAGGKDTCVWRVQVRRGFVKVDNHNVSATAVIGVEFKQSDIEKKS